MFSSHILIESNFISDKIIVFWWDFLSEMKLLRPAESDRIKLRNFMWLNFKGNAKWRW